MSRNGIEPARMERMTAHQTACGQPGAPQGPVPGYGLERILGAGWSEPAARRESRRNHQLVTANDRSQNASGDTGELKHGSPGTEDGLAPREQLAPECVEAGVIGLAPCPDDQIPGRLSLLNLPAPQFPQPPPETIAGHRGRLVLGDDESHPRLARLIVHPDHVQVFEAAAAALCQAASDIGRPREPVSPRQPSRTRQEPPCFDGSETVSRLRPFLRRRESTARPHRVAIRARNPCLLIRRLLRGRYDGFMKNLQVSREN